MVKYLGDGAMSVFSEENAADAINWAVVVQEKIDDAKNSNRFVCECSVGMATGEVVEFDTREGAKDYIGLIVDKAFRLCSAANARAIFVDADTVAAAAMTRIKSRVGITLRRKVAEYQGPGESITIKGFSQPVSYHEIFWAGTRFGVSAPFVTKLSAAQPSAVPERVRPTPGGVQAASTPWIKGRVVNLSEKFGFVRSGEEDFWFNSDQLFRKSILVNRGDEVWFIPADPFTGARSRRATDIVRIGARLDGRIERVMPAGFGFALTPNDRGELRQVFVYFGDPAAWQPGQIIEFEVGENPRGFAGLNPQLRQQ